MHFEPDLVESSKMDFLQAAWGAGTHIHNLNFEVGVAICNSRWDLIGQSKNNKNNKVKCINCINRVLFSNQAELNII